MLLRLGLAGSALLACLACESRPPDILLVSIDTVRADHLGAYGYPRHTSPFIDSLAAEGTVFEEAVAPVPATDPSHASLLTALHPLKHGVLTNSSPLPRGVETLAAVLSRRGYHTMGATAVFHLSRKYGFDQGFAEFSDVEDPEVERAAADVNASVAGLIEAFARRRPRPPFFLFVHYFDPHTPYLQHGRFWPRGPVLDSGLAAEARAQVDAYDSEIGYVDDQLRRLLARLGSLGLADHLLLCIASDHGEQLGEHGFSGGHADIYRETLHVPLVLRGPGVPRRRVAGRVSLLDVPVALLRRAGAAFGGPVDGVDLPTAAGGAGPKRPLLVLGYPSYTRSLEVLEGSWSFIRNLDHFYRDVFVETPARVDAAALARAGFREVPLTRRDAESSLYELPRVDFEPYVLSVVVEGRGRGCDAAVSLKLDPRLVYLREPLRLVSNLRVDYPVSRLDRTAVAATPGNCVKAVFARWIPYRRFREEAAARGGSMVSRIYENLLTARKQETADELYDTASDPGMLRNRIASPEGRRKADELGRRIATLFPEYLRAGRQGDDRWDYTPEEVERLRSLGYLR